MSECINVKGVKATLPLLSPEIFIIKFNLEIKLLLSLHDRVSYYKSV